MRDAPRYLLWPPIAILLPFLLAWPISAWRPLPIPLASPVRLGLALALGAAFVAVNGTAYWSMHRARTGVLPGAPATVILARWPFSWSRNPLYVGLLMLDAAVALAKGSGWALLLLPVAFAALHVGAVLPEERYLEQKFGEEYLSYKRRVRRWL